MSSNVSRRMLLRGLGGVAVGLPFLASLDQSARAATPPKRLVIVFSGNGTVMSQWKPTGSETNFKLSPILQPLAPYQSKLTVFHGVDLESTYAAAGDGHNSAMAGLLTGAKHINTGSGSGSAFPIIGGGISVDQHLAKVIGGATKFPSLEIGVQSGNIPTAWSSLSYVGAKQPVARESDPQALFDRIFGDIVKGGAGVSALRARRRSVLDFVTEDLHALEKRVDAADRHTLAAHIDAIRELEKSLALDQGGCQAPTLGAVASDLNAADAFPQTSKQMTDMLVKALACDLTRIATFQWRGGLGGKGLFPWLGLSETHHDISHQKASNLTVQNKLTAIDTWFAQQFAYLLGELQKVKEGSGTLLDNCAVLWLHELSEGESHSRRDMPMVLAGGCQGFFKTGRYLNFYNTGKRTHNDLLVTLCEAMGAPVKTFGDPQFVTGPLDKLRA